MIQSLLQYPEALLTTLVVDLGDGVKMDFVLIDPKTKPDGGKFLMGSPPGEKLRNPVEKDFDAEKQHTVEITKPYYLAKYPVTQEQYAKVVGLNPSMFRKGGTMDKDVRDLDTSRFPVENVSWDQATDFCKKEMDKYSVQMPGALRLQHYRFALPTEAQWEYACRAGTKTAFNFGEALNGTQANCSGTLPYGMKEPGPYKKRPTTVGEYGENKWGLCDMHGNVWQWCADCYGPYEGLSREDPERIATRPDERRVLRGGTWGTSPSYCRAAYRNSFAPATRNFNIGFRIAFRQY